MNSLKNHILIAMPHLQDPYFGRSVVFICEHTLKGAYGLIVNKPFEAPELKSLFRDVFDKGESLLRLIPKIYFGGPVLVERGILLHPASYSTKGTVKISEEFAITSTKDILRDIAKGKGPEVYRLMLGQAGWTSGQLEREIENGDWLLQTTTTDFIFHTPDEFKWSTAAKSFGIDTSQFSGLGGLA